MGVEITEDSIKACHIIPNSGNEFQLPTVICKYIYLAHKQSVYEKRKRLRKTKNSINNKFIYLNQPLPEYEAQIKNEANKRNMITATHNCAVSVLVENGRKKAKFVKINETEDLNSINAIKRKKHFEISSTDNFINSPAYKRLNIQKEKNKRHLTNSVTVKKT